MNLYVHFPFCRRKCAYCALHSRAGSSASARTAYAQRIAGEIAALDAHWTTVYFGGGSPALCSLAPVLDALRPNLAPDAEFTVELHPADVTPSLLGTLRAGGVNRISMGIQSFDDATLVAMGRLHTADEAIRAFESVRATFPNCGFDLIAGYPDAAPLRDALPAMLERLRPAHVSLYSLIREPSTYLDRAVREGRLALPSADAALGEVADCADILSSAGLDRYEISSYARPGFACRHNLAVWHGEDYVGLGDGAHGREGALRTVGKSGGYSRETLDPMHDALERELFALRTSDGFDPEAAIHRHPVLASCIGSWRKELEFSVRQGLAIRKGTAYILTPRGTEVCDAVLETLLAP